MEAREDLKAFDRRRFQTGRRCLDFTHTGGESDYPTWELLETAADAARFLGIILDTPPLDIEESDMDMIRSLRTTITSMATALAVSPDTSDDVRRVSELNKAATHRPLVVQLAEDGDSSLRTGDGEQVCSTLARDAIDLFASPLRGRIRVCDAHDCGLLFVDASRPGLRRWCSMDWCGDREKKRRAGRRVG